MTKTDLQNIAPPDRKPPLYATGTVVVLQYTKFPVYILVHFAYYLDLQLCTLVLDLRYCTSVWHKIAE